MGDVGKQLNPSAEDRADPRGCGSGGAVLLSVTWALLPFHKDSGSKVGIFMLF